jgi:hypothetical protein
MSYFLFDGVPSPFGTRPGAELPPLMHFERICCFTVLYFSLLALISLLLPRPSVRGAIQGRFAIYGRTARGGRP